MNKTTPVKKEDVKNAIQELRRRDPRGVEGLKVSSLAEIMGRGSSSRIKKLRDEIIDEELQAPSSADDKVGQIVDLVVSLVQDNESINLADSFQKGIRKTANKNTEIKPASMVKDMNQTWLLNLRETAIKDPVNASIVFGIAPDIAKTVSKLSIEEVLKIAPECVLMYTPRLDNTILRQRVNTSRTLPSSELHALQRQLSRTSNMQ